MLYIIIGIIFFGLLVAVHEWGHFITAKLLGVQVNEFSIGMGPALWSRQKGETQYSLRLFPIGGYCAMEGEDEDTGNPRAFSTKAPWRKIIILAAGSCMNLLAGFLIVVFLFAAVGEYNVPVISDLAEGCPAAGTILPGDRILSIDGQRISVYSDVSAALRLGQGETKDFVVRRDGKTVYLNQVPLPLREYTENGQTLLRYGLNFTREKATPLGVLSESWKTCGYFARSVWSGLSMLVRGQVGLSDMSGPVGIVSYLGEAGHQGATVSAGLENVLYVIALIAVNLAIMNMLPIPALDGGRIFLILAGELWFLVTRRRLDPKYEAYIHAGGFALLLFFMLAVTFSDVWKLID